MSHSVTENGSACQHWIPLLCMSQPAELVLQCHPIVQWCPIETYNKSMTVHFLCLITLSYTFPPSCPPIHLHILTRWSQRSNTRLWSHRMPAPCVHFPLFVSPEPSTHMEARAASCRRTQGGVFLIINLMQGSAHPPQATAVTRIYGTTSRLPPLRPARDAKLFAFLGCKSEQCGRYLPVSLRPTALDSVGGEKTSLLLALLLDKCVTWMTLGLWADLDPNPNVKCYL